MEHSRTGQIILLNGTSSAGKTSIARELLPLLDRPYYFMPVDALNSMRHQRPMSPDELEETLKRLAGGYHRAAAGMARTGNDVVLDHVLRRPEWLRECVELFPADVVFVKVYCPLPELQRREAARGDRPIGKAESHYPLVHRDTEYDVEVDTSEVSPRECAERIKSFVDGATDDRAFARLARRWATASL
jgi:chloramphenicol 3-O phosphotransferase